MHVDRCSALASYMNRREERVERMRFPREAQPLPPGWAGARVSAGGACCRFSIIVIVSPGRPRPPCSLVRGARCLRGDCHEVPPRQTADQEMGVGTHSAQSGESAVCVYMVPSSGRHTMRERRATDRADESSARQEHGDTWSLLGYPCRTITHYPHSAECGWGDKVGPPSSPQDGGWCGVDRGAGEPIARRAVAVIEGADSTS